MHDDDAADEAAIPDAATNLQFFYQRIDRMHAELPRLRLASSAEDSVQGLNNRLRGIRRLLDPGPWEYARRVLASPASHPTLLNRILKAAFVAREEVDVNAQQ